MSAVVPNKPEDNALKNQVEAQAQANAETQKAESNFNMNARMSMATGASMLSRPMYSVRRGFTEATGGLANTFDGLFDMCTGNFSRGGSTLLSGFGKILSSPFNLVSNLFVGKDMISFDHGLKKNNQGMYEGGFLTSHFEKFTQNATNARQGLFAKITGLFRSNDNPVAQQKGALQYAGEQYAGVNAYSQQAFKDGQYSKEELANIQSMLREIESSRNGATNDANAQILARNGNER